MCWHTHTKIHTHKVSCSIFTRTLHRLPFISQSFLQPNPKPNHHQYMLNCNTNLNSIHALILNTPTSAVILSFWPCKKQWSSQNSIFWKLGHIRWKMLKHTYLLCVCDLLSVSFPVFSLRQLSQTQRLRKWVYEEKKETISFPVNQAIPCFLWKSDRFRLSSKRSKFYLNFSTLRLKTDWESHLSYAKVIIWCGYLSDWKC